MLWKGNFSAQSIEGGFSRAVEDRLYVADGLDTAHTNDNTADVAVSTGTIPANTLEVGDILVFKGALIVSAVAGGELTVKWTYGTHPHHLNSPKMAVGVNDAFVWNYRARVKAISPSLDFSDTGEMWHIDSGTLGDSAITAMKSGLSGPPGGFEMYATDAADFKVMLSWDITGGNSVTVVRNHVHIIRP
jgi:hypothetical protein